MCGSTDQQSDIAGEQQAFYKQLQSQYQQEYGNFSGILAKLQSTFEPILAAGPNQEGFSAAEKTNLETQATTKTAGNYDKALQAANEGMNAEGGGDTFAPSGAKEAVRGQIASAGAAEQSQLDQAITSADYDQGRNNFLTAAQVLGSTASMQNPVGIGGVTNNAGGEAMQGANDVATADNAFWGSVMGALGGAAGTALGNGGAVTKALG